MPTPPVPPGWSQEKLHIVTHDNIRVWPQTYMYVGVLYVCHTLWVSWGCDSIKIERTPERGWGSQRTDKSHHQTPRKTPMAMTLLHPARNTMLIVIRGTLARQEWAYDFQYNFATPESGATREFPGRVHQVRAGGCGLAGWTAWRVHLKGGGGYPIYLGHLHDTIPPKSTPHRASTTSTPSCAPPCSPRWSASARSTSS